MLAHADGDLDIRFEERPPMQVKGREQQTRVYEVFRDYD